MEVVLGASIASQIAISALEYLGRHDAPGPISLTTSGRNFRTSSSPEPQSTNGGNEVLEENVVGAEPEEVAPDDSAHGEGPVSGNQGASSQPSYPDIETISSLSRRVAILREDARKLNAPDTLVEWAKASREAELLETRLRELRGNEPPDGLATAVSLFQRGAGLMGSRARGSSHRKGYPSPRSVRLMVFVLLGLYFWNRGDRGVLLVSCSALRPLAWLLAKSISPTCHSDGSSDRCGESLCVVSYYMFALFAMALTQRIARKLQREA